VRRASLTGVVALSLIALGCGRDESADRDPARVDDAFIARIVPHQHIAQALAHAAIRQAKAPATRRLARSARAMRRRTLPALDDQLARTSTSAQLPDLGVSAQQAADEVTPQSLSSAKPIDLAFLTVMTRHDQGALALAQAELRRGRDPAVKAAAQRLAAELTRELASLSRALSRVARRSAAG